MSNIIKTELCRGVTLGIIPTDRAKTDNLLITLSLPLDENVTKYALLARVLNRGTENHPSILAISRRLRELYNASVGLFSASMGETLMLTFSVRSLKQKYAYDDMDIFGGTALIVSEMLFHPYMPGGKFCEEYITAEKRLLADALRAQINDKIRYSINRSTELMCEGEPYAIPSSGRLEDIDAITADELSDCLDYIRNNGAVTILYAGELSEDEIKKHLSKLNFAPRDAEIKPATPKKKRDEVLYVTETMDIAQAKLVLGFKTDITLRSENYIKMAVLNEIYGGGTTSKLFSNVREKMSLCYFCSSMPAGHKDIMMVISGIEAANYEKARDAIVAELEAIKHGEITDEELASAKMSLANRYNEVTDSPAALCSWYLSRIMGGRSDSPEEAAKSLESVTKQDVADIAADITLDTVYLLKGAEQ